MGLAPQLITEEIYQDAVNALKQISKENRIAIRLRAIIAAKEHGVAITAKIFNITTTTLRSWVKKFKKEDKASLEYSRGRGRKSKLKEEHLNEMRKWIKKDSSLTIEKILKKLEKECAIQSSKSAVHRALMKLDFSYITPRPKHYKQKAEQKAEFKKKIQNDNKC